MAAAAANADIAEGITPEQKLRIDKILVRFNGLRSKKMPSGATLCIDYLLDARYPAEELLDKLKTFEKDLENAGVSNDEFRLLISMKSAGPGGAAGAAVKAKSGEGTDAATKVYAMAKRFAAGGPEGSNLFRPVAKPEYRWDDYDRVFMKVFFPKGVNKTVYLIHTTSTKFVYKQKDSFDKIKKNLALFFMYLNPSMLVDTRTLVKAFQILKSHADYFATKAQHAAGPDDKAATLLITEVELERFGLMNKLKRFQPNEPDVWSLSADDLNRSASGNKNLISYMVKDTSSHFSHAIEDDEGFVRGLLRLIILYRVRAFALDKKAQADLFSRLSYVMPHEAGLDEAKKRMLAADRKTEEDARRDYVKAYLEAFVVQGYVNQEDFDAAFGGRSQRRVGSIIDTVSGYFSRRQVQEVPSSDVLHKVEADHRNYLSDLFRRNMFEMMLSYYMMIYPEDEDKARSLVFINFEAYFNLADEVRGILAKRINDRWKVLSGEEIAFRIVYESLYRSGTPGLLINYHSGLKKRDKQFKESFDFSFPEKLSMNFRDVIYPSVYEEFVTFKDDPIIQTVKGELYRRLYACISKIEDLHCLNYLFGLPDRLVTHQKELILILLECFRREELPGSRESAKIVRDKVLFPPRSKVKFTTCAQQGFDTSSKAVYGAVKRFVAENPEYLELVKRLDALYENISKIEFELRRNYYLDVKDIRPTALDSATLKERRKSLDRIYGRYVSATIGSAA
jgi:hypothetical protein